MRKLRIRAFTLICALTVVAATLTGTPTMASAAPTPTPKPTTTAPKPPPAKKPALAEEACGGTLAFGQIVSCPSISGDREDVYFFATTKANDVAYTMLTRGSGGSLQARIYGPTGQQVCVILTDADDCQLAGAGTYKAVVFLYFKDSGDYTLSVQSRRTPSSCTTLTNADFSFASPGVSRDLPFGSAGDCFRFNQPVGTVLRLWDPGTGPGDVQGAILDGTGQPVCQVRYAQECTLSTAGPYQLNLYESYGAASAYRLRMSRISNSAGCPTLRPAPFGDATKYTGTATVEPNDGVACHKVRLAEAGNVSVRIYDGQSLYWRVYDDAGQQACEEYNTRVCVLPAGAYTIVTSNSGWDPVTYQIAVPLMGRNAGCAKATGLSWAPDAIVVHQTSAVQTNCQPFSGTAGDRVVVYRAPVEYNNVSSFLVNSAGEPICTEYSEEDGCVLPATGTYRVVSFLDTFNAPDTDLTYRLQVRRLSQPAGCPAIRPGAWNGAPAGAMGPIRCRILVVTKPGTYIVRAYDDENYQTYGSVYDGTGHRLCDDSSYCEIPAAGRYTLVLNGRVATSVLDNDFSYATTFLPFVPTGCPQEPGVSFSATFTAPGQYLCRQLSFPADAKMVQLLPTDARDSARPFVYVVDATGNYLCDSSWPLNQYSCPLTGTAPFTAVYREDPGNLPGTFSVAYLRVDGPPSCSPLPRGDSTTFATGAGDFAKCFSVPADQHGARESFTWQRTSGDGTARLWALSADGSVYCGPGGPVASRTVTCTLPDGPVTVLFEAGSTAAEYQLGHQAG